MSELLKGIAKAVREGNEGAVMNMVNLEVTQGTAAEVILNEGLVPGMDEVAIQFRDGEMFIPEVLMCAKAMQAGNDILKPLLVKSDAAKKGTIVIGTVKGDLHDIGKRIVGMMMEGAGYEVVDLGMDVSVERFIGALKETKATFLGMSAMLTTTMPVMKEVATAIEKEGLAESVKIMIGGAPVTDQFAAGFHANYSYDAASAVELAAALSA